MSGAETSRFQDLDFVPLGLAVVGKGLRIRWWNSCLENWTGVPRGLAIGQSLVQMAPEWEKSQYRERLQQVFEGGPPVVFSPVLHPNIIPGNSRSPRAYNVTAAALPDQEGSWLVLLSVEDITVLSQRIVKLRQVQKQSDLLMREIHHRVKNNLNMITGLISLQTDTADEATARTLEDLRSRILAIAQVHDVLYHTDDLAMGRVADYLDPLARLLDCNLAAPGSHQLEVDISPDLVFDLDTTIQLGLVQTELMTNALKYGLGGQKQGTLSIRLQPHPDGGAEYVLSQTGDTLPADFNPQASHGLGMQLIVTYAAQLGGELLWHRGDPTWFSIRILK